MVIYNKIQDALTRSDQIHNCPYGVCQGILNRKYPSPLILSSEKQEVTVRDGVNLPLGCLVRYELDQYGIAFGIDQMEGPMPGFTNYVDFVASRQQEVMLVNGQRLGMCRRRVRKLDKWTLRDIIVEQLKVCGGTFDMHKLPRIVEVFTVYVFYRITHCTAFILFHHFHFVAILRTNWISNGILKSFDSRVYVQFSRMRKSKRFADSTMHRQLHWYRLRKKVKKFRRWNLSKMASFRCC